MKWVSIWGCFALVIGSLCFLVACPVAVIASGPWNDSIAFDPLAWSPDGRHLGFGVQENNTISTKLFVVNVDGHRLHKLVDTEKQSGLGGNLILELRWGENSQTVYFSVGNSGYDPNPIYYAVDIESRRLQQVSKTEFLLPAASNSEVFDTNSPVCGKPDFVQTYSAHAGGLVAQSACPKSLENEDCLQKLQACNIVTGEKLFELDEDILLSQSRLRLRTATLVITIMCGVAAIVGFLVSIAVVVLDTWKLLKNRGSLAEPQSLIHPGL
jgi:hypothetical protein